MNQIKEIDDLTDRYENYLCEEIEAINHADLVKNIGTITDRINNDIKKNKE
jgi:hypothetical protein